MSEHLTDQELLLASDREGGSRAELHLAGCPACRARVIELQDVEHAYRAVHAELRRTQPAPPKAWQPLPTTPTPIRPRRSWPVLPFVAAAAAAVFLAILLRDPRPAALPAINDLLASAEKAQQPWAPTRRVALRSRKRSQLYIRPAVLIREAGAPHPLEGLFHKAGYNWQEPLSTRSYNNWRRALTRRQDSVAKSIDPKTAEPLYILKTQTDASSLQECTLSLRQKDLQPVSAQLHFEAGETVDIEEAAAAAPAPGPRIPPTPTTAPAPNLDVQELEVRVALHNIGADLGEPLSILNETGKLAVVGRGISPTRQAEITQALASLPNVATRFEPPQAAPPNATRLSEISPRSEAPVDFLESHLQGRMSTDQFINEALDASDAALARTVALSQLSQRYPHETEATLPPPARSLLADLRKAHQKALIQNLDHLSHLLDLLADGGRVPLVRRSFSEGGRSPQAAAQTLDTLLTAMLTGQRPIDIPQLQSALEALRGTRP